MRKYRTMVLAAGLLLTTATPVFAQAAIQEPGMFSFYHPNLDVLNGARRRPSTSLNRGQELRDPISGRIGPMRRIVLSDIDLTIRQQALSLAIVVVGIGVNKAVPRDKGRASHSALVFVVGQYPPDLIRSGVGGVGSSLTAVDPGRSGWLGPFRVGGFTPLAVGHIVRGRAMARGHTHAGCDFQYAFQSL